MHRILYLLAGIAAIAGLVMLVPQEQRGIKSASADATLPAGESGLTALADSHPQFAVMAELAPTFVAISRVQSLNLVRGLWLSDEQLTALIERLSEQRRLEQRYGELLPMIRGRRAEIEQATRLVSEVEAELVAGRPLQPGLESEVNRAITELMSAFGDFDGLEKDLSAFKAESQDAIYELLTPNQRILVQEYQECIIPPAGDPNNPELVGQASADMTAQLAELRAMSDSEYALARDHLAGELWGHILMHFPDQQQGKAAETARVAAALDEIRALDDQQYSLQSKELTKLVLPYAAKQPVVVPAGKQVNEAEVRARIFKFFIENNPVEVLKAWHASRRSPS